MPTMPRISSHAQSRRGLCIFLALLSLCGTWAHLSWGQESVLDRGPAPDSVRALNSPLDIPFLPLAPVPWALTTLRDSLRESLKSQLDTLPPFLRDTQVGLNLRLYYLNRDTATLFRQYIATPYVNQQDNRMTPNTFEAYRVTGKYEWVQFTAGYVADTLLPQPDPVSDDATAFDPAVDMLNAIGDSAGPGWPVAVPGSVPGRVILGRHEDLDLGQRKG
jgi:hypothetical protein